MKNNLTCLVCGGVCSILDVVDFNKSCEETRGVYLGLAGVPVVYVICRNCGFCSAPEIASWTLADFEKKIYNDKYVIVDPEYVEKRPRANAVSLISMFGAHACDIKHLDYGGGSGVLASELKSSGWRSVSYDPFVDRDVSVSQLGTFNLITAFEVFEHVPDVQDLMLNLCNLLEPDGVVLFSTLLSDGNIHPDRRISWWYASPRNGHISLFSKRSLDILARGRGLNFGSFSDAFHVFFRKVPSWAQHIVY